MKETLLDANFPRDAEGRTYHVGTKPGEMANRIITVGDHARARRIAAHFDGGAPLWQRESGRKFLTLTGTYRGTPLTVISIGMGFSLVDFFVRETRAVVHGELIIVRLGSCGSLAAEAPIGSVVVPKTSVGITRNYDAFHSDAAADEEPYHITRPLDCDADVHDALLAALQSSRPAATGALFGGEQPSVVGQVVNASTDSFYSSQGRSGTFFDDRNSDLIDKVIGKGVQTFEMETFVINHLARANNVASADTSRRIRVGAAQMVFANRVTAGFITPSEVECLEGWAGRAVCEALVGLSIAAENLQPEGVWIR
ncbi:purine and uridine phosphorylase [Tilletiopsis washingtonensis]|uniref:Purine and uridine phosphorylase n=1 Tax=Tilletiopsis washingtonensis TaxID=58919 RepID=A0A316ZBN9_9BASI|nr:purine and uridine phosphorylase [Tilletiopsis washingtonensis]PWN98342.1 purine and uridine phosphorylase [Tilletiopsis washingtonensis]